jgi:crotonobetainyl-CoA hydratase
MTEFCKVERRGRVTIVTLNRPDSLNAVHYPAQLELEKVWDAFAEDDEQWVGIITGAGDKAFSAGHDLKYHASGAPRGALAKGFCGLTARFDLDKPVIAAVNGLAVGGGFETALACDLVIADRRARFALPEPRVGLAAIAGGVHRLPRAVGLKRAMGMLLTGRQVTAQEGHDMGFVTALAEPGQALDEAMNWAAAILECSPMAVRATKQAAMRGLDEAALESAYNLDYAAVRALKESDDYVEGPKAFAEKRPPRWAV